MRTYPVVAQHSTTADLTPFHDSIASSCGTLLTISFFHAQIITHYLFRPTHVHESTHKAANISHKKGGRSLNVELLKHYSSEPICERYVTPDRRKFLCVNLSLRTEMLVNLRLFEFALFYPPTHSLSLSPFDLHIK